jgi:pimeloyl-ACP methyl ester carboxylesterase
MAKDYNNSRPKLTVPLIHINSLQTKKPLDNSERVLYVKYVGHYIPQESPKKFNRALDKALQQLNNQK